jgi:hypothetical protein
VPGTVPAVPVAARARARAARGVPKDALSRVARDAPRQAPEEVFPGPGERWGPGPAHHAGRRPGTGRVGHGLTTGPGLRGGPDSETVAIGVTERAESAGVTGRTRLAGVTGPTGGIARSGASG